MKKKALLIVALAVLFLIGMAGCTTPGGTTDGESEPILNGGETLNQTETTPQTPDETKPADLGASDVEIWADEDPTGGQNENATSGGNPQNAGGVNNHSGAQSGPTGGNQTGNQSQTGGNQTGSNQGGNEATEPDQPQQPTEPESGEKPTVPDPEETNYEDYMAMTPEQQQAFFESFSSIQNYMDWFNAAKAEYEANKGGVIVEGGNIDIGDYIDKP